MLGHSEVDLTNTTWQCWTVTSCPCRAIQDLQDRRARQERREELACLVGPARVAPWVLLELRVLQESEATLDLQGLWGALGCPGCLAPW